MFKTIAVLVLISFFDGSSGELVAKNEVEYFEFWKRASSDISLYPALPIAVTDSGDEQCRQDSLKLMAHLQNRTGWAIQMWDSSALSTFGVLFGNVYHFGNFDECIRVKEPIKAQYCNVKMKATVHVDEAYHGNPYRFEPGPYTTVWKKFADSRRDQMRFNRDEAHLGLCVPHSCDRSELEKGINMFLKRLEETKDLNSTTYRVEIPEGYCTDGSQEPLTAAEICFWTACLIIVITALAATYMDARLGSDSKRESRLLRILMSFSMKRNLRHLTRDSEEEDASYLSILHGIKAITIIIIVMDHNVMLTLATPIVNKQEIEESLRSWQNMFIPNGDLLVDTCFFVGGLLVTHIFLEHGDKIKVNPILIFISRLFRLAPLYYFIVWFVASGLNRLRTGPGWDVVFRKEIEYCQKNWWTNILFIQNYVNPEEMCLIHAWYLPCDVHFFMVALVITMLMKRSKKFGLALLYITFTASIIATGVITYLYRLSPVLEFGPDFLFAPRENMSLNLLYIKSHTRISVYLLGMITGYHLFNSKKSTWKLSKQMSIFGCIFALGLLFAPMAYGGHIYYDPTSEYDPVYASVFSAFRRVIWGCAWVVILIVNRFGIIPIFRKAFSSRTSMFLSKLTYSVYLVHFIMQMGNCAKTKIPDQFLFLDAVLKAMTDVMVALTYGFVLCLLIERPFRSLFKEILFPKPIRKTDAEKPPQQEEESKIAVVKL